MRNADYRTGGHDRRAPPAPGRGEAHGGEGHAQFRIERATDKVKILDAEPPQKVHGEFAPPRDDDDDEDDDGESSADEKPPPRRRGWRKSPRRWRSSIPSSAGALLITAVARRRPGDDGTRRTEAIPPVPPSTAYPPLSRACTWASPRGTRRCLVPPPRSTPLSLIFANGAAAVDTAPVFAPTIPASAPRPRATSSPRRSCTRTPQPPWFVIAIVSASVSNEKTAATAEGLREKTRMSLSHAASTVGR